MKPDALADTFAEGLFGEGKFAIARFHALSQFTL